MVAGASSGRCGIAVKTQVRVNSRLRRDPIGETGNCSGPLRLIACLPNSLVNRLLTDSRKNGWAWSIRLIGRLGDRLKSYRLHRIGNHNEQNKLAVKERRRSAFLDEFYEGPEGSAAPSQVQEERPHAEFRRRRKGVPLWILAGVSGILFCAIAVGGSSAMIWLRHLGSVFDVHWSGD